MRPTNFEPARSEQTPNPLWLIWRLAHFVALQCQFWWEFACFWPKMFDSFLFEFSEFPATSFNFWKWIYGKFDFRDFSKRGFSVRGWRRNAIERESDEEIDSDFYKTDSEAEESDENEGDYSKLHLPICWTDFLPTGKLFISNSSDEVRNSDLKREPFHFWDWVYNKITFESLLY